MTLLFLWLLFLSGNINTDPPPLILISIDGFRWDYVDKIATPHLDRMMSDGFRVREMKPAFPSLTFPNHYTLVTGKYPHHHGIVGNQFFDTQIADGYSMYQSDDITSPEWYLAPAIWEVAKRYDLSSASYFWVGSEMKGRQPDIFFPYDRNVLPQEKVATLLEWLNPAQEPSPQLMLAYFSFVDSTGHLFGPDSPEIVFAVQRIDALLGTLLAGIDELGAKPNVMIVSDHGMTNLNGSVIKVEDVVKVIGPETVAEVINNYSQLDLYLQNPSKENIVEVLANLPKQVGFNWFKREDAPYELHPTRNGHIVGIADLGFAFQKGKRRSKYAGGHGYSPAARDMSAGCFGYGPSFLKGSQIEKVRSVDVFALLNHLLGIPAQESDGELSVWRPLLNVHQSR